MGGVWVLAQLVLSTTAFLWQMEHEVIKFSRHQIIYTVINYFYEDNGDLTGEFTGIDSEEILRLGNNTGDKILHENLEKHLLAY